MMDLIWLAMASPLTGEQRSILPWIIGGIGLAAVIVLGIMAARSRKKDAPENPPENTDSKE